MHQGSGNAIAQDGLVQQVDELSALYRLTDRLYRSRAAADVYDAALDAIFQTLGCSRASVLLFDDTGTMRFVAWRGLSEPYRTALEGHSPWRPGERDPEPIFVEDIENSSEPAWVKAAIRKEGIRALGFVPLMADGEVIGKFMTYFAAPHSLAPHEIELAVTIARQVGFSLERARSQEARQTAEAELRESEQRFRHMLEDAPVMIWTSDMNGHCVHLNAMLREFWGVADSDLTNFDFADTIHPDDAPEIVRLMSKAVAERMSIRLKGRYRNADGEFRILETAAQPNFSASGTFEGMIGVNVDVTEREQSEEMLRASEERFRLAVEAAPSGMVMTDAVGRIVLVNAQAEKLFGYSRDELLQKPVEALVPERFRSSHPEYRREYGVKPTSRPMGAGRELFALRNDGSEVPVEIGLSPFETSQGRMALAAVVDISERKRSEAQRELLVAELNHRVKNTLAVVQAIAKQTFRGRERQDAPAAFEGRLIALAAAHDLLTLSNWENASLEEVAAGALKAHLVDESRIRANGPFVLLQPKEALNLVMVFHELFTNALKHGSLSNATGVVNLEWSLSRDLPRKLELVWQETGGPSVSPPSSRGFGSRLIQQTIARDLGGQVAIDFLREGVVYRIATPLAV